MPLKQTSMLCFVLQEWSFLWNLSDIHAKSESVSLLICYYWWEPCESSSELPFSMSEISGECILCGWYQTSHACNCYFESLLSAKHHTEHAHGWYKATCASHIKNSECKIQNLETHKGREGGKFVLLEQGKALWRAGLLFWVLKDFSKASSGI